MLQRHLHDRSDRYMRDSQIDDHLTDYERHVIDLDGAIGGAVLA